MKNIIIILCFPFIVHAQVVDKIDLNNIPTEDDNYITFQREIGPQPLLLNKKAQLNPEILSSNMSFPYPIIFIHGLMGDWESWWDFYGGNLSSGTSVYGLNDWGWTFGGYLDFCLNATANLSNQNLQAVCNINADITKLTSGLVAGDYYIIDFDCNQNTCSNITTNNVLSNQAAIILQGRALGEAINDVLQATGKEKVILVGHSMGGLAAREYLQNSTHWQGYSHHRVAKLMTTGTPHGGSNSTQIGLGILGLDEKSDAVRDLRRSYSHSGYNGAYLFGANPIRESNSYIQNNIAIPYHNVDVNCNDTLNEYVYGRSNSANYGPNGLFPFPLDLEYSCIMGNHGVLVASDGVVLRDRADISNYSPLSNSSPNFEKWEVAVLFSAIGEGHKGLSGQHISGSVVNNYDYVNFKALDEPDNSTYAYKLDFGTTYTGHLTYQGDNFSNSGYDNDYYKFTLNQPTSISLVANDLPANTNSRVYLYDINQNNLAGVVASSGSAIIANPGSSNFLNAGTYYLKISGNAYGSATGTNTPWNNPYTYEVNAYGCTDPLASNYNAQANIDNNSCCYSASITQNFNSVDCFGGADGSITNITVNGGTPPYLFSLNNGNWQINNSFYSLPAGNYTINVKDNNNCTYTQNQTITQPTQIMLNTFVLHPACYGQNYGSVGISNITGGTPPYSYLWNDPQLQTTPNASGLYAGNYKCTVTDANGCIKETPILYINQPQNPLSVNIIHNATTLLANGSGGTPSYSYQWYGPNGFISNANQITPQTNGQYYVVITDVNACTSISESYLITYITSTLNEVLIDGLLIYPNPSKEIFNIQFNSLINQDISVSIYNIIGEEIMQEELIEFKGDYIKKIDLNKYKKGIYFLEIETDTGMIINKLILQ